MAELPPPPINQAPRGLLDFLGIKNGGRYPQTLLTSLHPTIELFDWYLELERRSTQLTAAASPLLASVAAGINAGWSASTLNDLPVVGGQIVVPNGEIWYVPRYAVNWNLSSVATNVCELIPMLQVPQIGTVFVECRTVGQTQGVGGNSRAGTCMITRPLFLLPGTAPRYFVQALDTAAGSIAVFGTMEYVRMRI